MGVTSWGLIGAAALAWAAWMIALPFLTPGICAAALCVAVWPVAKRSRKAMGRRASSLLLAGALALGAAAPAAWAWGHAFSELDALVASWPAAQDAPAAGKEWTAESRGQAREALGKARGSAAWIAQVEGSKEMPWGALGMMSIMAYFMLADGLAALAWTKGAASHFGPRAGRALDAALLAFAQTAKGCVWFGAGSLLILWGLFAWAGAPSPLAFAVAGACASMVPFVAPVMVAGVAASLLAEGNVWGPMALLIVGAGGLGVANNILRPKWIGDSCGLPMAASLVGMAGGAIAWGPAGLLAGPAIVAALIQSLQGPPLRTSGD